MNTKELYNEPSKKEFIVLSKESGKIDIEATEILKVLEGTEIEARVIKLFIRFGYKIEYV
jgi:hypothetical protein